MAKTPKVTTVSKNSDQSYLQRLTFVPSMANTFVAKYINNIRIVLLLIITIVLVGTSAYFSLPKRLNPEVKIPIVTVVTVIPGASSKDVEQLVTVPLEGQIRNLSEIDVVNSSSTENVSVISIQFVSSIDADKAKDDVQSSVDSAVLPTNAQPPQVKALDFEDVPVWTFALTGSGSYPDLMRSADALRQQIEDLGRIDRVNVTGFDQQEISVNLDASKLALYKISPFQISDALRKARASYPAGRVVSSENSFALTVDPAVETVSDIRNLQLTIDGRAVSLGEVATIQEKSAPNQAQTLLIEKDASPQSAVLFYVYKTTTSEIDAAGKEVNSSVKEFTEQNPNLRVTTLSNTSQDIADQFSELIGEFRTTILLVFVTLLLFLGLRQAFISLLTVPLTFLSSFFLMQFVGMSINFLSMFAFLLALGLLVDDTIVVVSAMTAYYKTGRFTPLQTGILVWRDTIVPIWSTTITTIWAFVPLLISTGIIGEFIKPIPIVVTITMLSSTAVAVLITLPLMIVFLKPSIPKRVTVLLKVLAFLISVGIVVALAMNNPLFPVILVVYVLGCGVVLYLLPQLLKIASAQTKRAFTSVPALVTTNAFFNRIKNHGIINVEGLGEKYRRLILNILKKRSSRRTVIGLVLLYSIFSFALLPLGFVKNEFFPKEDSIEFFVDFELPSGAKLEQTEPYARPMMERLIKFPGVQFVTAEIGRSSGSNSASSSLGDASNNIHFSVRLHEKEDRKESSQEIAEMVRQDLKNYDGGKVTVVESSGGGPPAGADLQIALSGSDLTVLNGYADKIVEHLQSQPGVNNVQKSIAESTSKVRFVPDYAKLAENGVTVDSVGMALRLYASGFTLDQVNFDENTIDKTNITFRMQDGSSTLNGINQAQVTNSQGQSVPLSALGEFKLDTNPTSIVRDDFKRTVSVTGAVTQGYSITDLSKGMEEYADSLNLAKGYEWKTGGVNEENAKSVQSILQAMGLSAILILVTMVVQFQSFRQALIVLIVIPLAVSSVFLAFALTGVPLSFPALIGILSLFGIVVTNSMFIVDKINLNLKEKMEFNEAIADAGASRLEPIILTKLSTVLGLLPITLSQPLWQGLGGAIISGLLVASTIMLLFIPILYFEWMATPTQKRSE